jgi:hypothetical protein
MACTLSSVWSLCATVPREVSNPERNQMNRDRMFSDEVMDMRRRRLNPTVQPVEMNKLYNRRRGARDAHVEYVIVELASFDDGDERTIFSPLTSTTAGSSPPRTAERQYAL